MPPKHSMSSLKKLSLVLVLVLLLTACGSTYSINNIPETWDEARGFVYPQIVPKEETDQTLLIHRELSPRLDVTYVLLFEDQYAFIAENSLIQWEVDEDILHQEALRNLDRLAKKVRLNFASKSSDGEAQYVTIEKGDGLSASYILSPTIRQNVVDQLGEPFIAAIPMRDFLIFWKEDFSLEEKFREQVLQEYEREKEQEENYALSPEIFRMTAEGMEAVGE